MELLGRNVCEELALVPRAIKTTNAGNASRSGPYGLRLSVMDWVSHST